MNTTFHPFRLRMLCVALLAAYPVLSEAAVAGRFQFVAGDVRVIDAAGKEHAAQKGQDVNEGETVLTAAGGSAQLKMIDGGVVAVRPGTQLKVITYVYNGAEDGSENAFFSLIKGGLRAITGVIGKANKDRYRLQTPTATIGIRGTDHEPMVLLAPEPGEVATNPPGTYDKVNVGATSLTTDAGTTIIAPNQVGFAAALNQLPVILPKLPDFYRATQTPQAKQDQKQKQEEKQEQKQEQKQQAQESTQQDSAEAGAGDKARSKVETVAKITAVATNLTATDASGNVLDLLRQRVLTSDGQLLTLNAEILARLTNPSPALITTYAYVQPADNATVSSINAMVSNAQATLANVQTQLAGGSNALSTTLTALNNGNTSLDSARTAFNAASVVADAAAGDVLMHLDSALLLGQQAVTTGMMAYNGGGATNMSSGAVTSLDLANRALQAGNRVVSASQALLSSNTDGTRQDFELSLQVVNFTVSQLNNMASNIADQASSAAAQAASLGTQAADALNHASSQLAALSPTTPGYAQLQAALDAASAAVTAAQQGAGAASNAAAVALNVSTLGSNLSGLATEPGDFQFYNHPFAAFLSIDGSGLSLTRDASGHLTAAKNSGDAGDSDIYSNLGLGLSDSPASRSSFSQSGSILTDLGRHAAGGLTWGRWEGGQVTQSHQYFSQDASGNWGFGATNEAGAFVVGATQGANFSLGKGSLHWITGVSAAPGYLPAVLTGTANYSLVGGTRPTDALGNVGTLDSASLGVNFTTQIANASVNFSIGGNAWGMKSGDMYLDDDHFASFSGCKVECASSASVTKNGVAQNAAPSDNNGTPSGSAFGTIQGMLLGTGLNAAALQYSVQEHTPVSRLDSITGQTFTVPSNNLIQGVAAFSGPTQDITTPFRAVAVADGWGDDPNPYFLNDGIEVDADDLYRGSIEGDLQAASRVVDSAAGLTEFAGEARGYTAVNQAATAPEMDDDATRGTVRIGSAVNRDVGAVTIGGATVSWGRWEGGNVDIYSRDGSVKIGSIDNSNRSIHWLASSVLNADFSRLPLTGTATYTLAGNTNPTDMKGNVGTLGAVTLNADFANAKANAGINVSFNSPTNTSNWNMTANNIPLGGIDGFRSSTALNGANGIVHTASCSGASCGAQTVGYIDGHFFSNAQGAVMVYGMATGAKTTTPTPVFTPQNVVSGLVVMKQ